MNKLFKSMAALTMACAFMLANGTCEAADMQLAASTGGMSASSPAGRCMTKFAELVNEYTKGAIEIQVFFDTTLGNPTSAISGIQQGTVDLVVTGDSYYSGLVPEIQAFELPYTFANAQEARAAVKGPAGDYIKNKLQAVNIKALAFWEIGFRELTNNTREVKSVADLKGIKLRCLPAKTQVTAWESAGAMPVPMDISELYSSLQQGVVDGEENTISEIYNQRFYEVQKYMSLTDHAYTPMLFSCSLMTWGNLTPDQQNAIQKAADEAQQLCWDINDAENAKLLKEIEAAGVKLTTDVDKESIKAAMAPSRDLFISQNGDGMIKLLGGK